MTTPSHSSGHTESATERCWAASTGSESLTVVPSVTEPARGMVPVAASNASTSVVLTEAECPTSATLRIFSGLSAVSKVAVAVLVPAFLFDIPAPRQIVVGSLQTVRTDSGIRHPNAGDSHAWRLDRGQRPGPRRLPLGRPAGQRPPANGSRTESLKRAEHPRPCGGVASNDPARRAAGPRRDHCRRHHRRRHRRRRRQRVDLLPPGLVL